MGLDALLRDMMRDQGSIPLEAYMGLCLRHPQYGYYITQTPLGAEGDFTTSPEISQLFGEMVAIWCVQMWEKMGSPSRWHLCELGPGRGTLMVDVLRTLQRFPLLYQGLHLHLVDIHPVLRELQYRALAPWMSEDRLPSWSTHWPTSALDGPTLMIANEFLDALPIQQCVWDGVRWWDHHVTLGEGSNDFALTRVASVGLPAIEPSPLSQGWIVEIAPEAWTWYQAVASTLNTQGGGALWIDYGTEQPTGCSTWRGFSGHHRVDPLCRPGTIDLTADVNFEMMQQWACGQGYAWTLHTQKHFLHSMGIGHRLQQLLGRIADHEAAYRLISGYHKIMDDLGHCFMVGTCFSKPFKKNS